MGALSSNHEIKCAVKDVDTYLQGKGCWVIDREADRDIERFFFTTHCTRCIIRLKRNTKLIYKGESMSVEKIAKKKTMFLCTQSDNRTKDTIPR